MDWEEHKSELKKQKEQNHQRSMEVLEQAKELARENGFSLIRHSPWHFALVYKRWIYNIYPANQRIYVDPKRKGPFLEVTRPWTLLDVVTAAICAAKPASERIVQEIEKKVKNACF